MPLRANAESGKRPVVLLATAERWTSTARLSLALRSLGCELALLAPGDHPALLSGAIGLRLRYDPFRPLHSLREAIVSVRPTAILPADETTVCHLGELWETMPARGADERRELETLLRRSLGDPDQLCKTGSRMVLQHAAEAEGVRTPATREIASAQDLRAAFQQLGTPLVMKADATSGGRGVCILPSLPEAERAFRAFSKAPHVPRAFLRGLLHRDWTHLRRAARRERRGVCVQEKIAGVERTAMVVALRGEVLALQCFEVVHTWKERGPSSVLRRVSDPRMQSAIHKLVGRLQITGFSGFDFIVDDRSGEPLLLERNARPTQVAHLSFGPGHDLAAAYVRAVVGRPETKDRATVSARDMIALFPQELQRDPQSPVLREGFHDVPWESPALMERALRGEAKLYAALRAENDPSPRVQESGVSLQTG